MGIPNVNLKNINLDEANSEKYDPKTIVHLRLLAWQYRYKQRKAFKKEVSKWLMSVVWHPTRWWDWCMPEDGKKKKERNRIIFIDEK